MAAFHDPALWFSPWLLWADLAMKNTEILLACSQEACERVDRMARAAAAPSLADRIPLEAAIQPGRRASTAHARGPGKAKARSR